MQPTIKITPLDGAKVSVNAEGNLIFERWQADFGEGPGDMRAFQFAVIAWLVQQLSASTS